jgi:vacuolar-type H+-ATPase subunit C/Vma6
MMYVKCKYVLENVRYVFKTSKNKQPSFTVSAIPIELNIMDNFKKHKKTIFTEQKTLFEESELFRGFDNFTIFPP